MTSINVDWTHFIVVFLLSAVESTYFIHVWKWCYTRWAEYICHFFCPSAAVSGCWSCAETLWDFKANLDSQDEVCLLTTRLLCVVLNCFMEKLHCPLSGFDISRKLVWLRSASPVSHVVQERTGWLALVRFPASQCQGVPEQDIYVTLTTVDVDVPLNGWQRHRCWNVVRMDEC